MAGHDTVKDLPERDPFVAPSSSPQARDARQATTERDLAKPEHADRPKGEPNQPKRASAAAKASDDDDEDKPNRRTKADREQAKMEKADREAESGKRPSAHSLTGMGAAAGSDRPATRTWACRHCGTEIEVPADQSHPAESKCFGCRQDVEPDMWIPRGGAVGGVVV